MRRLAATCAALAAIAAVPAAADASTATTADGNLRYQAAAGEINNVSFRRVEGDTFKVTDLGATITAGTGCTQDSPNIVTCTTAPGRPIIANLSDGTDRAASKTSRSVQLYGEDGNDRLAGASGRDTLDGGPGDDTITGGPGRDVLRGGIGNDQLFGASGNDSLQGNEGDDLLVGGSGNDSTSGGLGNDTMRQEEAPNGADSLAGNSGFDTVDYSLRPSPVYVSINDRPDDGDMHSGEKDNVRTSVERVLGSAAGDVLIGRDGPADTLIGGTGDDVIEPLRGDDHVDGGPGIDQIRLRDLSGDDVVCGDGVDSVAADDHDTTAPDCEHVRRTVAMTTGLEPGRAHYPTVMVHVSCPASAFKFCAGRLIIRTLAHIGPRGQPLTVAARNLNLAVGQEAVIGVRIRSGTRRYLGHGLAVRAALSAFDGAGPARRDAFRFTLRPR